MLYRLLTRIHFRLNLIFAMATRAVEDFFPVRPTKTVLNGRHTVLRKLSSDVFSDTWLVRDEKPTEA